MLHTKIMKSFQNVLLVLLFSITFFGNNFVVAQTDTKVTEEQRYAFEREHIAIICLNLAQKFYPAPNTEGSGFQIGEYLVEPFKVSKNGVELSLEESELFCDKVQRNLELLVQDKVTKGIYSIAGTVERTIIVEETQYALVNWKEPHASSLPKGEAYAKEFSTDGVNNLTIAVLFDRDENEVIVLKVEKKGKEIKNGDSVFISF